MRPLAVYNMFYKKKSPIRGDHKMYVFVICLVPSLLLWWNLHFFLSCPDESSLCLLKGGRISDFTMAHAELPVLHDAFTAAITSGCQKTSYIVQFLWRDLTSGFELIDLIFLFQNLWIQMSRKNFSCCAWRRSCVDFHRQQPPLTRRQQVRELSTLWTYCLPTLSMLWEIQCLQCFAQVIR